MTRHLRLVSGKDGAPPKKRYRYAPTFLTEQQQNKARAALKNLCMAYGGWEPLAEVMGMHAGTLSGIAHGNRRPKVVSPDVLLRLCKAGGLSVDAMLDQPLSSTGRCTACGARRISS